jgi:hypothetical protein
MAARDRRDENGGTMKKETKKRDLPRRARKRRGTERTLLRKGRTGPLQRRVPTSPCRGAPRLYFLSKKRFSRFPASLLLFF